MTPTVAPVSQLQASAAWRAVDLISDLHLQASEASTFELWQRYMDHTPADAVLILGDLFEVWVGDDAVAQNPFLQACAEVLKSAGQRLYLGVMHGNRDFLIGESFVQDCHAHFLADPCVLRFGEAAWLLSHGDALCLADQDYQQFRRQVRTTDWRNHFLKQSLAERQAVARSLRDQSEARKRTPSSANFRDVYADADSTLSQDWLTQADALTLIHGHTHQPADHVLSQDASGRARHRRVLSDWDAQARPPRAQVLRLFADGQHQRIPLI
jgi:UDP-2,3-diacylglucosamine hydrolase